MKRALLAVLFCVSCGDPGLPNSAYGMLQDDGGDFIGQQCLVPNGCQAGATCCGNLCCTTSQVCCTNANGSNSCGTANLVGDACGGTMPFGP